MSETPPPPLIRLRGVSKVYGRGDAEVRYESVGRVVLAAQRAGISKVGFITEPPPGTVTR